jgi:Domain of unknown function (DUF1906)
VRRNRFRFPRVATIAAGVVAAVALAGCLPLPPPPPPPPPGVYSGLGFDTCVTPSTGTMSAWLNSPFRRIGIYLGGANYGCGNGTLSASWVSTVSHQGWRLAPLYVGLQAPCQTGLSPIDPNQAGAQGSAAADDAVTRAANIGLGGGTPIYFDMEGYNSGDVTCRNAVLTFVTNWVAELHNRGYVAGYYSSSASGIADEAAVVGKPGYQWPDDIWFANWNNQTNIFGDPYFSDALWSNHQRLHQYQGGHDEAWGGVLINIDRDVNDGQLAG